MVKGFQIIAALIGAFGGFTMGLIIGWTSPSQEKYSNQLNITKNSTESNWIGTIMTAGAAVSGLPLPPLLDIIGRRVTMQIMALLCFGFYLLLGFAKNFAMFMVARIFLGFCGATFCVTSPMYVTEVVETSIRGALGVCFQLLVVVGIFVAFAVGPHVNSNVLNFMSAGIIGVHFLLMFFIPETPVFLMKKGKDDESVKKVLRFLHGKDYDVDAELEELKREIEEDKARSKHSVWKMLSKKPVPKAMGVCIMLALFQQLSGINAILFFANTIFEHTGMKDYASWFALATGGVQVIATLMSALVVDRWGRKTLLISSYSIMCLCLTGMSIYFFCVDVNKSISVGVGIIPLVCICIYMIGFSLGAGPLTWSMLGEMFATEARGIASSICSSINWCTALAVSTGFSPLIEAIKGGPTYIIFAVLCLAAVVCIYFFTIETKGKEIEQIQRELGKEDEDEQNQQNQQYQQNQQSQQNQQNQQYQQYQQDQQSQQNEE